MPRQVRRLHKATGHENRQVGLVNLFSKTFLHPQAQEGTGNLPGDPGVFTASDRPRRQLSVNIIKGNFVCTNIERTQSSIEPNLQNALPATDEGGWSRRYHPGRAEDGGCLPNAVEVCEGLGFRTHWVPGGTSEALLKMKEQGNPEAQRTDGQPTKDRKRLG